MKKKVLILGHTGKTGTALCRVLKNDFEVIGKNSKDFDAFNFEGTTDMITKILPDILINSVVFMGVKECETSPDCAF